jgi:hypothetical protein
MARGIGPERRGRSSARADAGSRRPSTTHLRSRDLATLGPTAPCVPQRPLGVARGSAPTPGLSVRVRGVAVSPPVAAAASTSSRSVQLRATRATPPAACFTSSATAVRPITRGTSVCRLAGSSGACSELPDPNRLEAFDRNRRAMVTMAENVDRATPTQLAELVQLVVERVKAVGRTVDPESLEWTPPARPFFGKLRGYGAPGRTWRSSNHKWH